jgi:hypothetical protein
VPYGGSDAVGGSCCPSLPSHCKPQAVPLSAPSVFKHLRSSWLVGAGFFIHHLSCLMGAVAWVLCFAALLSSLHAEILQQRDLLKMPDSIDMTNASIVRVNPFGGPQVFDQFVVDVWRLGDFKLQSVQWNVSDWTRLRIPEDQLPEYQLGPSPSVLGSTAVQYYNGTFGANLNLFANPIQTNQSLATITIEYNWSPATRVSPWAAPGSYLELSVHYQVLHLPFPHFIICNILRRYPQPGGRVSRSTRPGASVCSTHPHRNSCGSKPHYSTSTGPSAATSCGLIPSPAVPSSTACLLPNKACSTRRSLTARRPPPVRFRAWRYFILRYLAIISMLQCSQPTPSSRS